MSDQCLSLAGSRLCSAFGNASISTRDASLVSQYPFLANVGTVADFDQQLEEYVTGEYARIKYEGTLSCDGVDASNASGFYARYTTSVLCNSVIQNSRHSCGTSHRDAKPLCADSCAQFAESEESIILSINACKPPSPGHLQLIRADFITCSLPIDSLRDSCVSGADNEPNDCGFGSATTTTTSGAGGGVNLPGLCHYCAKSSENATDSCCVEAKAETRCNGINLPSVTIPPLFPPSIKSVDFSGAPPAVGDQGLSGGKVAGAVIGGLAAGAVLLLALLFWFLRRRGRSGFMQPRQPVSPERKSSLTPPADADAAAAAAMFVGNQQQQQSSPAGKRETSQRGVDQNPLPAGIRTASLGDHASDGAISSRNEHSLIPAALYAATPIQPRRTPPPPPPPPAPPAHSSSSPEESSATSGNDSSQSDSASPTSTDHSERLTSFKDHYSPDDIHPNDEVAVLWPYLPRAPDEFQLERGEMLRIVGIWDDGWATGYKVNSRAEDWGVGSSGRQSIAGSIMTGRGVGVKAFPLICVCLPQYWQACVDADIP